MLSSPIAVQAALLAGEARSRLRAPDAKSPDAHRCPVYAPHGSIIPLHRRYFAAGGNLVHPVFLFNEEITVAEQCRRLGLTVMFEPSLRVIHEKHQSTRLLRSWRILRAHVDAANYGYRVIAGETA